MLCRLPGQQLDEFGLVGISLPCSDCILGGKDGVIAQAWAAIGAERRWRLTVRVVCAPNQPIPRRN
ncbi:hypothetical protein [Variovorax sp. WS11]|uniref:hypothetical protein n=1 Tax=Variovorax sp. WS11 TaxID=1105204 RepID=UPI0011B2776E|nr:hypothetical protein [Variovorax sp. WS11]NDZ11787.1 hypothetical protein [Variovorax sp. WS11]